MMECLKRLNIDKHMRAVEIARDVEIAQSHKYRDGDGNLLDPFFVLKDWHI